MYGERIRQRREDLKLSQIELAMELSTSLKNIELWEEEQESPSVNELIDLAETLGTSVDWLIGFSDEDDFDDDLDEDYDIEDFDLETADFFQDIIIPHMEAYREENEESAYVHVQLSEDDDSADCVIYSGEADAILAAVNLILDSLSKETDTNYYDIVAAIATAHTELELGIGEQSEEEER